MDYKKIHDRIKELQKMKHLPPSTLMSVKRFESYRSLKLMSQKSVGKKLTMAKKKRTNTPSIIRRTGMKTHCLRVDKYEYDQFRQCETSTSVDYINIMQKMTQKCKRLSPYDPNYAK